VFFHYILYWYTHISLQWLSPSSLPSSLNHTLKGSPANIYIAYSRRILTRDSISHHSWFLSRTLGLGLVCTSCRLSQHYEVHADVALVVPYKACNPLFVASFSSPEGLKSLFSHRYSR
jgi:hypothetical protein